jgi:hypothetical protein
MDNLLSIIIGVLSSLSASFVFLLFISMLRPKIIISKQISVVEREGTVYVIKIINKGKRPIVNIKARLYLMTPTVVPGGIVNVTRQIQLRQDSPMEIASAQCTL